MDDPDILTGSRGGDRCLASTLRPHSAPFGFPSEKLPLPVLDSPASHKSVNGRNKRGFGPIAPTPFLSTKSKEIHSSAYISLPLNLLKEAPANLTPLSLPFLTPKNLSPQIRLSLARLFAKPWPSANTPLAYVQSPLTGKQRGVWIKELKPRDEYQC